MVFRIYPKVASSPRHKLRWRFPLGGWASPPDTGSVGLTPIGPVLGVAAPVMLGVHNRVPPDQLRQHMAAGVADAAEAEIVRGAAAAIAFTGLTVPPTVPPKGNTRRPRARERRSGGFVDKCCSDFPTQRDTQTYSEWSSS